VSGGGNAADTRVAETVSMTNAPAQPGPDAGRGRAAMGKLHANLPVIVVAIINLSMIASLYVNLSPLFGTAVA